MTEPKWDTAKKMTPEELEEFKEFRPGETLGDWIGRQLTTRKDPWRHVKKSLREADERKAQRWVEEHRWLKRK